MKEIISARTRLSDIGDTICREREPLVTPAQFTRFQCCLDDATSFLHPLVDEYRKCFLEKVSHAQLVDEALNKKLNDGGDCDPSKRSTLAWKALQDKGSFPALAKVRDFGDLEAADLEEQSRAWRDVDMTKEFFTPLKSAIGVLVECRTS
jgi:hypothetical protein